MPFLKRQINNFLFLPFLDLELLSLFYFTFIITVREGFFIFKSVNGFYAFVQSSKGLIEAYADIFCAFLLVFAIFYGFYVFVNSHLRRKNLTYSDRLRFSIIFYFMIFIFGFLAGIELVALPQKGFLTFINALAIYAVLGRALASVFANFTLSEFVKKREYEERIKRHSAGSLDFILIIIFGTLLYFLLSKLHYSVATTAVLGYFYTSVIVFLIKKGSSYFQIPKFYGSETPAKTY